MRKLLENDIINEYNNFKALANQLFGSGEYEQCLKFIDLCSRIAYNFNFIYFDNDLENLLIEIGNKVLINKEPDAEGNRYVFYDYFGLDSRGLTQQYIRALIALGKQFLYILSSEDSLKKGQNILSEIYAYDKAFVHVLKKGSFLEKIQEVEKVVYSYNPQKAFLHLSPWDVVGVTFWTKFKIRRYFINLTDHAFWLGVNSADYFLEFRPYGYKLSADARGIAKAKLLLLPYYPIQKETEFLGFPVDTNGKIVGFSGSAFYKIYGRSGMFFTLIKKALIENKNFIFLLAGSGNTQPINKFIEENNFEGRFVLVGDRSDINEVFKHIDVFINTYPVIGGLMTQLAVLNSKPLITYTSPDLAFNFIEDFLRVDRRKVKSMFTEDEFFNELNNLIKSSDYRLRNVENYKGSIPTVSEFNSQLEEYLLNPVSEEVVIDNIKINYGAIKDLYLETENDFLNSYDYMKLYQLRSSYFLRFPISALRSLTRVIAFHGKSIINKEWNKFAKRIVISKT